jgi:hypothetical protein
MQVTSEHFLDDGILEVPGIVWTPATATPSTPSALDPPGHPVDSVRCTPVWMPERDTL